MKTQIMRAALWAGIKRSFKQMVKRTAFLLAGVFLTVASGTTANAQTLTTNYAFSVPLSATDWSNNVPVQQFSPALGILEAVTLSYTGAWQAQVHFTNNGNGTAHVTMSEGSAFYVSTNSLFTISIAFSGLAPQQGGFTNSSLMVASGFAAQTFTNSLNTFIGVGNLSLPVSTSTEFSLTTTGSSSVALQTLASLNGLITYTYLSATPSPVPEPGPLNLLAVGTGLLLARRRWSSRVGLFNKTEKSSIHLRQ